jgi:transposase
MSLFDVYKAVEDSRESDQPALFRLLDEHIDWYEIIPDAFFDAFYKKTGRERVYDLESFMRALLLQDAFHYVEDTQLLNTLRYSREMRVFCQFKKVPDAAKLTRFKQEFCDYIRQVFERLVDLTEPICREMDAALADMLIKDTTGIVAYVAENNPKRLKPNGPDVAASNPQVKRQYINGYFCYAHRAAILTNGLGIVRHLELLDDDFRAKHPELPKEKRTKSPEIDKEVGDSTALKPVLLDFRAAHPTFHYKTFLGDAAFDSYDNYTFLLKEFGFKKAIIPLNPRNSLPTADLNFNENGTPLCPVDATPFKPCGSANGLHRSPRLKFICPKSKMAKQQDGRFVWLCQCGNPCTTSKTGRCVHIYPDKNLRLYPGISRDDPLFETIYKQRTAVERSISSLKGTLCLQGRKTSNTLTTKADLFLAGISQLLCVLLASKLHKPALARRTRLLLAA